MKMLCSNLCSLLLLMGMFLPSIVRAQVDSGKNIPVVTHTYALENARVVQAPGRILQRATVIIRDGLIVDVGPEANVPFDAERIAADSLTIYAGFIDGLSHAGLPTPKEDRTQERPDNPAYPPNTVAGIQPDRDVRTMLDPKQKNLKELRETGFTAAHVVPHGRMLPGSGAIILLAGDNANALVFKSNMSLFSRLAPARRVYPGTDMAIMAKWRQLYHEAQRRQRIEKLYAEDPSGLERPAYDPVHYALFPVLDGEKPVYFHTESVLDLHRVISLQDELDFPVVLAGLQQSFDATEKLQRAGHPLILSLDLPNLPKKEDTSPKPADSTKVKLTDTPESLPEVSDSTHNPGFRTHSFADTAAEKKNLEARRALEHKKYLKNAATLHDAGLPFAFSTMDTKPTKLLDNVRSMIEHGLPEDAALAALTTTPARILGVSSSMGTVEQGKIGNLVVTTGPIFEKDTHIRYVFVDGRKFIIDQKKNPGNDADSTGTVNPAGEWSYTVSSPQGATGGIIHIEGSPGSWSGSITNDRLSSPVSLSDVTLNNNMLRLTFEVRDMGTIIMNVTITNDDMEGTVTVADADDMPVTGNRMSNPK